MIRTQITPYGNGGQTRMDVYLDDSDDNKCLRQLIRMLEKGAVQTMTPDEITSETREFSILFMEKGEQEEGGE